ncbi:MAG: DUF89 family protein [Thermoleophilia bacterium]|nr:DUF89 family protein [Thermoleophilia bacterium]
MDCIPCFVRQALDAARAVSDDPAVHESIVREVLAWMVEANLDAPPPHFAQRIHRRLSAITGAPDPHRAAKDRHNQMAMRLLPELRAAVADVPDPLELAVRLAIAGNVVDMGVTAGVDESDLRRAVAQALEEPLSGDCDEFRRAVESAGSILYLADNAGEIAFDRLLVEQLRPDRVTVAVRGAPVINDATRVDARAVGLDEIAPVIDNGSDAPGTILSDCTEELRRRFVQSDVVIAKGQGNFESLCDEERDIFFLFRVKCRVIADRVGRPIGTHVLMRSPRAPEEAKERIRT